jgi:hypothetical protein
VKQLGYGPGRPIGAESDLRAIPGPSLVTTGHVRSEYSLAHSRHEGDLVVMSVSPK